MTLGATSSNTSSFVTELPDIFKNLLIVLQNESSTLNEYLVEIDIKAKKKEIQNNDYGYDVAVIDESVEKIKKKKKQKKHKKDDSKFSRKRNNNCRKKKDSKENSKCHTVCKTLRTRSDDKKSDDDMIDSDDRYPDESLENLPYLNDSQRQLLRALRQEQTKKNNKKEKCVTRIHHIAVPWDSPDNCKESSFETKLNSTPDTSSFSRHYPYVPRTNAKTSKKVIKRDIEKFDVGKKSSEKEAFEKLAAKKQKSKEKNKKKQQCYVNAADVFKDDKMEEIPPKNENISNDMRKIFG